MRYLYPAIFEPLENHTGYCVSFPDFPGCVTEGYNLQEAISMAQDAASLWILDELENNKNIPERSDFSKIINISKNSLIICIIIDIDTKLKLAV